MRFFYNIFGGDCPQKLEISIACNKTILTHFFYFLTTQQKMMDSLFKVIIPHTIPILKLAALNSKTSLISQSFCCSTKFLNFFLNQQIGN